LLAPFQNVLEVEQYQPVGRARVRIAADGRDVKVVSIIEEYPEKRLSFFLVFFLDDPRISNTVYLTYASKPNLADLLPSSNAVMHVGPTQGFLSLLVPSQ